MTSGYNTTTVSISLSASDILSSIAKTHGLSKVDIVSALLLACAVLDREQVDRLISMGHLVKVMEELGGVIEYPNNTNLVDSMKVLLNAQYGKVAKG